MGPYLRACGGTRVYPRACGGTGGPAIPACHTPGLSPRMRGNPRDRAPPAPELGSIPAHAGEPDGSTTTRSRRGVYPRACGGTQVHGRLLRSRLGLSPRMRGNRVARQSGPARMGSIPAHAGEPSLLRYLDFLYGVYPRACGGTSPSSSLPANHAGLSPRMRGNHGSRIG